jgi:FtsH-binding integral membrane protein
MVSYICAFVKQDSGDSTPVFVAAVMTLGITLALTLYTLTTKTDFTTMGGLLYVLCMSALLFGFFFFLPEFSALYNLYCFFWAIIYGAYIVYDTQLIVGGKTYELSIEDYIIGALILYIDIIGLFIRLLQSIFDK